MELGQKLKQARLDAGLSQRQLCGDKLTRNMLSLIENGAARPSMDTLRYLASRLEKSVSYFLEEQAVLSPNTEVMAAARRAYDTGDWAGAVKALEGYHGPDEVYDREMGLVLALSRLRLAEAALADGRELYALELLSRVESGPYFTSERERLLLLMKAGAAVALPSLDEELLVRAQAAGDPVRAARLLDAAEGRTPRWNLLRGQAYLAQGEYEAAAACFREAEEAYPMETARRLEICCRELGDYKMAYFYACKQREE